MRRLPPLSALRAFEAAARHLSFKEAAAELSLTPTAISHQVCALEQILGRPLFRRRPRPLTLTEAGATLFPVICNGLDALAEAVTTGPIDSGCVSPRQTCSPRAGWSRACHGGATSIPRSCSK